MVAWIIGLSMFSVVATGVCVWLSVRLYSVKSERDGWASEYQTYVQRMYPLIRYLEHCNRDRRRVTDEGLHSAFAMIDIDYETWIEQVVDAEV